MNYTKIYCQIVFLAKSRETERKNQHKHGVYFEIHHILPKSLGGTNDKNNLVRLTGREHFICHWLLVKIYPIGTDERYKMLNALWKMQSKNGYQIGRYINAKAYEKLRIEWASCIGKLTALTQSGRKNSQYGKHWYTNIDTGESASLYSKPSNRWIEGRNWFNNVGQILYDVNTHEIYTRDAQRNYSIKYSNILDHEKITYYDGYYKKYITVLKNRYDKNIALAHQRWDTFHAGAYTSLRAFAKTLHLTVNAVYNMFKRYIPAYSQYTIETIAMKPNQDLIGVYD